MNMRWTIPMIGILILVTAGSIWWVFEGTDISIPETEMTISPPGDKVEETIQELRKTISTIIVPPEDKVFPEAPPVVMAEPEVTPGPLQEAAVETITVATPMPYSSSKSVDWSIKDTILTDTVETVLTDPPASKEFAIEGINTIEDTQMLAPEIELQPQPMEIKDYLNVLNLLKEERIDG